MNALKNIVLIVIAGFGGYLVWKTFKTVSAASSAVTTVRDDAASFLSAIENFPANAFAGGVKAVKEAGANAVATVDSGIIGAEGGFTSGMSAGGIVPAAASGAGAALSYGLVGLGKNS